jgi:hypothetical protein
VDNVAKTAKSKTSKEEELLTTLGKLNEQAEQVQSEIDKLTKQSEDIQKLNYYNEKLGAVWNEMDVIVHDNSDSLTGWKPDRISKGKKDIIAFGTNAILRSKTTRRKIIPSKFVTDYPLEANVLIEEGKITIPIGVVEAELGKNKVNEICESTTTFSYKYESRKIPTTSIETMPKTMIEPVKKTTTTKAKKKVTAR